VGGVASIHVLGSRQFGGADQFYVRLVQALAGAGEEVTAVCRTASPVSRALGGTGVQRIELPLANKWDAWSAWRIHRLLKSRAPCVVQTYMGRATRLTRAPRGLPVVHVARLGGFYKIDGYYRHAHAWVGNTRAICDYLVREGLPAGRVFHIGNFVPDPRPYTAAEREARRESAGIARDDWVLFSLGRLIEKKGFQDLLAALARLPGEVAGRRWVALVAGDGEDRARLEEQAVALGLATRVRWLGWQDPPDPWYDLADLVLVPSRHEPLGNVILEAWNYQRPVVSTASEGACELIHDGENGILVPLADPAALGAAIRNAMKMSGEARAAVAQAGKRSLEAGFGKSAIVGAYVELHERLLSQMTGGG